MKKMQTLFGKKQVLLATMILALGVAVYLNYYFSAGTLDLTDPSAQPSSGSSGSEESALGTAQYVSGKTVTTDTSVSSTGDGYFDKARQNRAAARGEALELLEDMLDDVKVTDEIRREVLERTAQIARAIEQESDIESLIVAKGFGDCVVYIDGENANVVVQAESLTSQQALQITEIVVDQSDVPAQNVKISPVIS